MANNKQRLEETPPRTPATLPKNLTFQFRTLADINEVVSYLSQWVADDDSLMLGLKELMINAVEHGNLGIGFALKTKLLESGDWLEEIEHRLKKAENLSKFAHLEVQFKDGSIRVIVEDKGEGFNPGDYIARKEGSNPPSNGRGLKLINNIAFDKVDFKKGGRRIEGLKRLAVKVN